MFILKEVHIIRGSQASARANKTALTCVTLSGWCMHVFRLNTENTENVSASHRFSLLCEDRIYLNVDLIVSGSMYGTIQAKPHYGYSSVNIKSTEGKKERKRTLETPLKCSVESVWSMNASPDSVAGTTVPPSTLDLLESINAALLPPEAAARSVDVFDPWFGVYCKV